MATPERFIIGLAQAEVGYIYPKMTFDPRDYPDQHYGPGPDMAAPLTGGLCNLIYEVTVNGPAL